MSYRFSYLLYTLIATTTLVSVASIANSASLTTNTEPTIEINFDVLNNNTSDNVHSQNISSPFQEKKYPPHSKPKKHKKPNIAIKSPAIEKAVEIKPQEKIKETVVKEETKKVPSSKKEAMEKAIEKLNDSKTPVVIQDKTTVKLDTTPILPVLDAPKIIVKETPKAVQEVAITPPPPPAPVTLPTADANIPSKEIVKDVVIAKPTVNEVPAVIADDNLVGTIIKDSTKAIDKKLLPPIPPAETIDKTTENVKIAPLPVPPNPTSEFAKAINEPTNANIPPKETVKNEDVKSISPITDKPKLVPEADPNKPLMVINFLTTETNLPLSVEDELKKVINTLKNNTSRVTLIGYASESGDQTTTARRVSLSRVLAVRSFMIDKGVNKMNINVQAEGSHNNGGSPDRVDILLSNTK